MEERRQAARSSLLADLHYKRAITSETPGLPGTHPIEIPKLSAYKFEISSVSAPYD